MKQWIASSANHGREEIKQEDRDFSTAEIEIASGQSEEPTREEKRLRA